jgi:hypothetical protein
MHTTHITIRRVKLYGGYTKRGEYFGLGGKLWRIEFETEDDIRITHVRASDYQALRAAYKSQGTVAR